MGIDLLAESIKDLSLKDLRGLIAEGGLSAAGCVDKSDLQARASEALERLKMPGAKLGPISMRAIEAGKPFEDQAEEEAKAATAAKAKKNEEKRQATFLSPEAQEQKEKEEKEAKMKAHAAREEQRAKEAKVALKAKAAERAAEDAKHAAGVEEAKKLFQAIKAGDAEQAGNLLTTHGAACRDAEGNTPLHTAAGKGLTSLCESILAAGGEINALNTERRTPLHLASLGNKIDTVRLLLDSISNSGALADIEAKDENDQTPLRYAELNKRVEVAAMLVEAQEKLDKVRANAVARAAEAKANEAKAAEEKAAAEKASYQAHVQAQGLVGKQVIIGGLMARPDANGMVGYVLNAMGNGRCTVAIKKESGEVEQLALKPDNLTLAVDVS